MRGIDIIRHLTPHPLFPSVLVRSMKGELSEIESRLLNVLLEQMARGEWRSR